ncbi:hypothetical protein [Deinococcus indicus]|uniref:hypothetical protein n=1 Tax=Deinococcus indicus TaxID=223556 RepID=UPI001C0E9874|nr:hypothetical protein [Deinococcus indicus]
MGRKLIAVLLLALTLILFYCPLFLEPSAQSKGIALMIAVYVALATYMPWLIYLGLTRRGLHPLNQDSVSIWQVEPTLMALAGAFAAYYGTRGLDLQASASTVTDAQFGLAFTILAVQVPGLRLAWQSIPVIWRTS